MNHLKVALSVTLLGCSPDLLPFPLDADLTDRSDATPEVVEDRPVSKDSEPEVGPEPTIESPPEVSPEPIPDAPQEDVAEDVPPDEVLVDVPSEPLSEVGVDVPPDQPVEVAVDSPTPPDEPVSLPDVDPCPGLTQCGSVCVDTRRDSLNCGGCGTVCNLPGASESSCLSGSCVVGQCRGTLLDCDRDSANGCETESSSDPLHCGRCGDACPSGGQCSAGRCLCPVGTSLCGTACVPSVSDVTHCGGCSPCPSVLNAVSTCVSSVCSFLCNRGYIQEGLTCLPCGAVGQRVCESGTCNPGLLACGGVCRDTSGDRNHCGACGRACPAGFPCGNGSCVVPRSCMDSPSLCGITAASGGSFDLGDVSGQGVNALPVQRMVTVGPVYADTYEVTVGRFRVYWSAGHPAPGTVSYPSGLYSFDGTVTEPGSGVGCTWRGSSTDAPINCANWSTAQAFCAWDGGRLPTEAEWEWLARGPGPHPWGSSDPEDRLVCWSGSSVRSGACSVGSTPMGSTEAGLMDMAGGVYEWTADSFQPYSYSGCWGTSTGRMNPLCGQISGATTTRTVRGGSWETTVAANLRVGSRISRSMTASDRGTGFRCVRSR